MKCLLAVLFSIQVFADVPTSLTLDEKIGQLFIFGFRGTQLDAKLRSHLTKTRPGGVIVFSHNIGGIDKIRKLNRDLFELNAKVPMFIAVDQEGGSVSRIKLRPSFPSALALGATNNAKLAERMGYLTGETLRSLGFNMNLAPVMDIADPQKRSFIGTRSFGGNPTQVAHMAVNYSKGLMMAGILPTAKHFPGHGGTVQDSHKVLPQRNLSINRLQTFDLVPFREYVELSGMSAMMIAHVAFPKIDPSGDPASFSKPLMQDLLRSRLGYRGLVITDDFDMGGAKGGDDYYTRVIRSLKSGADMVMIAWSKAHQRKIVSKVRKAIERGELSIEDVDTKVSRILAAKEEYLSNTYRLSQAETLKVLSSKYIKDSFFEVLEVNFEKQKNLVREFFATQAPRRIISGSYFFNKSFKQEFGYDISTVHITPKSTPKTISRSLSESDKNILYVSGRRSAWIANQLADEIKRNTLLISVTKPFAISESHKFGAIINLYSPHPRTGQLVARSLKNLVAAE